MKRWKRLASLVVVPMVGIIGLGLSPSLAGATKIIKPTITGFSATPVTLYSNGGIVTLSATVSNASGCTFTSTKTVTGLTSGACSSGTVQDTVIIASNLGKKAVKYKFGLTVSGTKTVKAKAVTVTVSASPPPNGGSNLSGVVSMASGGNGGYCAVLTTSQVDCWGYNADGELGNGTTTNSDTPTQVVGVGGTGTLSGVASLTSDNGGYCALLASGGVDCWGYDADGRLGNGNGTDTDSDIPTQVVGVGGTGTLSGVSSLTSDSSSFCTLLATSEVDCWGQNNDGNTALGNGTDTDSDIPTQVVGVGGTGTLSGVSSLTSVGGSYCTLLTTSEVDCWGANSGELGNGTMTYFSETPTQVVGVGGTGTLSGVISLTSGDQGDCALLTTSQVDCWGNNTYGELGNGTTAEYSDTPTQVVGVGGTGTLSGVTSLTGNGSGQCAVLTTSQVDCWGDNGDAELGNGTTANTDAPTQVVGVGGTGTLTGVASVTSEDGYCALLTTSQVDCWGDNTYGDLGNGTTDGPVNFFSYDYPTQVVGIGGTGTLAAVTSLTSEGGGYCALITTSQVDCWGYNSDGELGNGTTTNSDTPTQVVAPS